MTPFRAHFDTKTPAGVVHFDDGPRQSAPGLQGEVGPGRDLVQRLHHHRRQLVYDLRRLGDGGRDERFTESAVLTGPQNLA